MIVEVGTAERAERRLAWIGLDWLEGGWDDVKAGGILRSWCVVHIRRPGFHSNEAYCIHKYDMDGFITSGSTK